MPPQIILLFPILGRLFGGEHICWFHILILRQGALQRHDTENSKQIFSGKGIARP
jgi:hypothetical protein